jgi:hypothetical protein
MGIHISVIKYMDHMTVMNVANKITELWPNSELISIQIVLSLIIDTYLPFILLLACLVLFGLTSPIKLSLGLCIEQVVCTWTEVPICR